MGLQTTIKIKEYFKELWLDFTDMMWEILEFVKFHPFLSFLAIFLFIFLMTKCST
jgi:hypothetical protein